MFRPSRLGSEGCALVCRQATRRVVGLRQFRTSKVGQRHVNQAINVFKHQEFPLPLGLNTTGQEVAILQFEMKTHHDLVDTYANDGPQRFGIPNPDRAHPGAVVSRLDQDVALKSEKGFFTFAIR